MWKRWEERFKQFGATKISFTTSKQGGNRLSSANTITSAKCLLFFYDDSQPEDRIEQSRVTLAAIIDQTLCSEKLAVSMLPNEDFKFWAKCKSLPNTA